jgi:hypothetical protein
VTKGIDLCADRSATLVVLGHAAVLTASTTPPKL